MSVLYADRGDDGADRKKRSETFHFVPPSLLLANYKCKAETVHHKCRQSD